MWSDLRTGEVAREFLNLGLFFGKRVKSPGHVRSYLL